MRPYIIRLRRVCFSSRPIASQGYSGTAYATPLGVVLPEFDPKRYEPDTPALFIVFLYSLAYMNVDAKYRLARRKDAIRKASVRT